MDPDGMVQPLVSLVIATVDRVDELEACLASLCTSALRDVEVLVVDQNTDLRIAPVIEAARKRVPVTWLRQDVRNASRARNAGVAAARGTWVGFPDDDCRFCPDTLSRLCEHIRRDEVDLLTGMTRDDEGNPSVLAWSPIPQKITPRTMRRTLAESTLYLRREFFLGIGGFDPAFGPGSTFAAEEVVDLFHRIRRRYPGARTRYFPDICFLHGNNLPLNSAEDLVKIHVYAFARGACFAKHWHRASVTRLVNELGRHLAGSVLNRPLHRRRRLTSLAGYLRGFFAYRKWLRSPQRTSAG